MTRISEAVECLESLGYEVTPPGAAINAGIQNGKNTWSLLMDALAPKPDPRADLVDLFEARAETHDDKSWIEVEEAVDVVVDNDWQQSAEITDEQVEVAARAIHDVDKGKAQSEYGVTLKDWERLDEEAVGEFFEYARAALEAARGAQS